MKEYPVVGQRVECIAKGDWSRTMQECPALIVPRHGQIYTIREVYRDPFQGHTAIRLVEIVNPDHLVMKGLILYLEAGWLPHEFRPLDERETDISVFTKLLMPTKVTA